MAELLERYFEDLNSLSNACRTSEDAVQAVQQMLFFVKAVGLARIDDQSVRRRSA